MTGHDEYLANLQDRIRTAYTQLASQPGAWVSLTELRPYVGGHRELVDEALRRLARTPAATLAPESNQKILTAADREAAVEHGNQAKHLLAIS